MIGVPTRDSYTMSVVQPHERVAMAVINTVGRSVTLLVAFLASTALWQASVPIIACPFLKMSYDPSLYFMFQKIKAPHEIKTW